MARRESPEHHLTAIAAVAAISLVLAQTINDRPSSLAPSQAAVSPAEVSCDSLIGAGARHAGAVSRASAERPSTVDTTRASCFQGSRRANRRIGAG